jgi:mannose-6-phosphate isomerase-like protein (cupin superfamily)
MRETLAAGDSVVWTNADAVELAGSGLAVVATYATAGTCPPTTAPPPIERVVVRASAAPKLDFAKGAMSVHLDVGAKVSPELYLGRLEGTAAVPEHDHPTSWEILAAVEASGTFVLDGIEKRLGPKQIVVVPPGTKHAWRPDAGSKLVAIQMYSPPGPEQRFVALAAAEKDAGKDAR